LGGPGWAAQAGQPRLGGPGWVLRLGGLGRAGLFVALSVINLSGQSANSDPIPKKGGIKWCLKGQSVTRYWVTF
jgi:hypothetical protein